MGDPMWVLKSSNEVINVKTFRLSFMNRVLFLLVLVI